MLVKIESLNTKHVKTNQDCQDYQKLTMSKTGIFWTETRPRREVTTSCETQNEARREIKQILKSKSIHFYTPRSKAFQDKLRLPGLLFPQFSGFFCPNCVSDEERESSLLANKLSTFFFLKRRLIGPESHSPLLGLKIEINWAEPKCISKQIFLEQKQIERLFGIDLGQTISDYNKQIITLSKLHCQLNETIFMKRVLQNCFTWLRYMIDNIIHDPIKQGPLYYKVGSTYWDHIYYYHFQAPVVEFSKCYHFLHANRFGLV